MGDSHSDAEKRYNLFRNIDPFPNIKPALLNSADVYNYIKTIGMVFPFDEKELNGVTLSLKIGDSALYWDEDKKKIKIDIKEEKEFTLKSNTIAYVSIKEELRLPAYIIARFNLRVTNAYKGILLGTGPIVDPGFEGKLFIPLHNLTNNDYVFYSGDTFIEMEFTKISENTQWLKPIPPELSLVDNGVYKKWKPKSDKIDDTKDREIEHYLRKANLGKSINSSLPSLTKETKVAIDKATKLSDHVDTSLSRYNIGLLFSFAGLLGVIFTLLNIFKGDIKEIKDKKYDDRLRSLEELHKKDSLMIDSLKRNVMFKVN